MKGHSDDSRTLRVASLHHIGAGIPSARVFFFPQHDGGISILIL